MRPRPASNGVDAILTFNKNFLRTDLPDIRPGDTIKIYQQLKEGDKTRVQPFEGLVIARKHGKGVNATITVRKVVSGVGVEKIIPIHSPTITKIEGLRRSKVRRAKLYYIREKAAKEARRKMRSFSFSPDYPPLAEGTPSDHIKISPPEEIE